MGQNPYLDPGPWGTIAIGGNQLPGIIVSINGAERPEQWDVQKGTAASGATIVWKGTTIADGIEILIALPFVDDFGEIYDVVAQLRPKLGTKPPSFSIINAIINFNGITQVSMKNIGQPTWVPGAGYWTVKLSLVEYRPSKPANAGPASSNVNKTETENDRLAAQLAAAVAAANKAGNP